MQQESPEDLADKRKRFDALHTDPKAKDFRAYWQKEGETARVMAAKIKEVITGATPVSDDVIAESRAAVLRLNQIAYVLGELSLYLGGNSDVIQAAMEIVSKHQDLARDAAADVRKMIGWSVIPGVPTARIITVEDVGELHLPKQ